MPVLLTALHLIEGVQKMQQSGGTFPKVSFGTYKTADAVRDLFNETFTFD